ncbi:MAG: hypothetical protein F7B18_08335 [Desulfurococcales archaeon]|nr:hypothetical protein [Desulfurococcales archaeon]
MVREGIYRVKAGSKEIEITEEVLETLQRYVHTEMTLEELAAKLDLEGWEEAYDFLKNLPAWILWIHPTLWKTMKTMEAVREEVTRPGKK